MSVDTALAAADQFHATLAAGVTRWHDALRQACGINAPPEAVVAAVTIPPDAFATPLPDALRIREAIGERLAPEDKEVRQRVDGHLRRLVIELAGHRGETLWLLSELAWEHASHRMLTLAADRFDVSARSVLAAAALNNFLALANEQRRRPGQAPTQEALRSVSFPLQLALETATAWRPGDLWLLDLFARTARRTLRALWAKLAARGHEAIDPAKDPLAALVARFLAASAVQKLVEADQLEEWLASRGRYKEWPGLAVLVGDPGAGGLRRLVVGEVARRVAAHAEGPAHPTMIRFLEALAVLEEGRLRLQGRLLAALLLWELLDQHDRLLGTLCSHPHSLAALRATVQALEADRYRPGERRPPDSEWPEERHDLDDLCCCLEAYDQYRALVASLPPAPAPT